MFVLKLWQNKSVRVHCKCQQVSWSSDPQALCWDEVQDEIWGWGSSRKKVYCVAGLFSSKKVKIRNFETFIMEKQNYDSLVTINQGSGGVDGVQT